MMPNIIKPLILVSLTLLLNIIFGYSNLSLDLTNDKKHTISNETKKLIKSLDDKIFIKVYLEGELPAEFKHLQASTYNLLKNLKDLSPSMVDFEFINPNTPKSLENKKNFFQKLIQKGLAPTDLEIRKTDEKINKIIFPGAIIYYKEKHIAVNFLKNRITKKPGDNINLSIENLEYEFVSSILHLKKSRLDKIAFLEGNGELSSNEVYDIVESVIKDNYRLSYYFDVERFNIKEFIIDSTVMQPNLSKKIREMNKYKVIIIAKPTIPFNNIDKLLVDQFIMNGGKVIWLIDGVNASMNNLKISGGSFIAMKNNVNLDDQLFKYGVRINANLIEDLRALKIPIITGYSNNKPQQDFFTWPFYPLLISSSEHPISRGLDAVKCNFVSSIDTIRNNIQKTILLHSSKKSRLTISPSKISLGLIENPPPASSYNKGNQTIAILLEGKFESVFSNRILPKTNNIKFKNQSLDNKMIVISDGDFIANEVGENKSLFPMGYDKYTNFTYMGNKHFIINAIQYLCEESNISQLKSKQLELRMLDKQIINKYRSIIQFINIILPQLLLMISILLYKTYHKNKYE